MDLSEKIKALPPRSGVYMMKDASGRVLYVGKAKNLRARVKSYLKPGSDGRVHIRFLMDKAKDLEWLVTATEKDALILENTLIKKLKPRYNIDLKDDKTYLSLRVDMNAPFPRIDLVRQVKKDGALYLGPYSSARDLRETVALILGMFPLRSCGDREFANRTRPCLYHWTRKCPAPCTGLIGGEEYKLLAEEAVMFLRGKNTELMARVKNEMEKAAGEERYEEAAALRDRLKAVSATLERIKTVVHKPVDRDVISWTREGSEIQAVVLIVRGGAVLDRRAYHMEGVIADDGEFAADFLRSYYREERIVPREITVQELYDEDRTVLAAWLTEKRGGKVSLEKPLRGEKADVLAMARENAVALLAERRKAKAGFDAALTELGARLGMKNTPSVIECFDVSLFQGGEPVAAMVTLVDGQPDKSRYRRFRIKTVEGTDDFAMIHEAVTRRAARAGEEGWELPSLILIDGGPGQLSAAEKALSVLGENRPALASLAKARTLPGKGEPMKTEERVFLPGRKNPVLLKQNSSALFMLMKARDEAHRYAISFHRKVRSGRTFSSELDGVPGLGPARKKALLKRFGSVKALRAATLEEISSTPGIPLETARAVLEKLSRRAS